MLETIPGYHRIDPRALSYWRWAGLLNSIFIWLIPLSYQQAMRWWELPLWIFPMLMLLAVSATVFKIAVIPKVRWNTWLYDVSEQQIDLRFGVFVKYRTLIPMVRVQHVDTEQGPLLSHYGLSTVTISTAAGKHKIPALADDVAAELRERISRLARMVDEDV